MAKLKSPLLSLKARGSLGGALLFDNHQGHPRVRKFPVLPYTRTLPQQYQRWLYQDAGFYWQTLSDAQKQSYRSASSRLHIPRYAAFIKDYLLNLPDIAGMWHLDEKSGAVAHDASKYHTHGTIFGATPTKGIIDGAQYFTLDDYIKITAPQLDFTSEDFSLVARIYVAAFPGHMYLFGRGVGNSDGWNSYLEAAGAFKVLTSQAVATQISGTANGAIVAGNWYTVGWSRGGASISIYRNGLDVTTIVGVHIDPLTSARSVKIGIYDNLISFPFDGIIDHLIIFTRAITAAQHLAHSQRRYP